MNSSTIFKNITYITADENDVIISENSYVTVSGDKIVYAGKSEEEALHSVSHCSNIEYYYGKGKILMPSFYNSHTHLAMTLMRNKADDTTLHKWLFDMIFPVEDKLRPEDIQNGNVLGIAEMIKSGSGCCANMYMNYMGAVDAQVAIDTGIKMNTVFNGGSKDSVTGKFNVSEKYFNSFFDMFEGTESSRIRCGILVHSIYLYNHEYYYQIADLAKKRNTFIHIHISETEKEVNDCIDKYKMRPPAILEKMGIFNVPCLAAHCVFLDDSDIDILKKNNVTVVHNPTSNLKLGSGIADIKKLFDRGVNVALGTDGPASNNTLDIYNEMRLASYLAKGIHKDASVVSAKDIFKAATINGARALGFIDSGMIKKGYQADLQVIDPNIPSMSPPGNPLSAVVYSANGNCVESLMVSGKMLMRKRQLLTIDEEKALYDAKKSSEYLYG